MVEGVVGRDPHALRRLRPQRDDHVEVALADGQVLGLAEEAVRLGLLDEGDVIAAPDGREDHVRLGLEQGIDVRSEVALTELRPHFGHDLHVGPELLQLGDEVLAHPVPVLVIGAGDGVPLERLLGHQDGRRASLDEGVGRRAEGVPVSLVLRQGRRLGDGDEEDGLVLLGHLRDGQGHAAVNDAGEEIDLLLEDEVAGLAHSHVGLRLVVADDELELSPEHPSLAVDLLDGHLVAGDGGLGVGGSGSAQSVDDADLDGFLGGGVRGRAPEDGRHHQYETDEDHESLHRVSLGSVAARARSRLSRPDDARTTPQGRGDCQRGVSGPASSGRSGNARESRSRAWPPRPRAVVPERRPRPGARRS